MKFHVEKNIRQKVRGRRVSICDGLSGAQSERSVQYEYFAVRQ